MKTLTKLFLLCSCDLEHMCFSGGGQVNLWFPDIECVFHLGFRYGCNSVHQFRSIIIVIFQISKKLKPSKVIKCSSRDRKYFFKLRAIFFIENQQTVYLPLKMYKKTILKKYMFGKKVKSWRRSKFLFFFMPTFTLFLEKQRDWTFQYFEAFPKTLILFCLKSKKSIK